MRHFLIVVIAFLSVFNFSMQSLQGEKPKYLDTSLDFETRAGDLVRRMTLEEKISQLGSAAPAVPRLGIPAYNWWNECLHGVARAGTATVFPQAIGLAATFDTKMMRKTADIISTEARAKHHEALRTKDHKKDKGLSAWSPNNKRYKGLTFWSPNINIFRDPRWGRGQETYGEDPYLTGQMGIQFVKGLQGDHPKYLKVVATAKHYAVHNGPEPLRHTFNVTLNTRDLWETYLPAFKALMVDARAYSLMGAYNRIDGESASASWLLLEDILRNKWGFEGYVVSDCGAVYDIFVNHKIVNTAEEAAAIGIRRGCDLNCGQVYQQHLLKAVKAGFIDAGEIDLSVYRLMLARMKLGMFDPPEIVPYAQIPFSVNDSKPHDAAALETARKSMTLLKNNGILPLDKIGIKKIAVVGPNAGSKIALHANYHGKATHPVTVIAGIKKSAGENIEISFFEGCPLVIDEGVPRNKKKKSAPPALSKEILNHVKAADLAVFVGGLDASWEGEEMASRVGIEGFDRGDRTTIELPASQLNALRAMKATGTPIVLVLMAGSAVAFDGLEKELDAVLMAWYPGQRGGDAVADVLFGHYNPAGRLPVTFYSSTRELADFEDYNMRAGKGFTYRYYNGDPLYPFGHGLSYTRFEYSGLKIDKTTLAKDGEFTVSLKVKNAGDRDGEEVVQLYTRDIESDAWTAKKQLRKFQRIALKKGEEKAIRFKLKAHEDLRYYNSMHRCYMVEPGGFEIQVGASSEDIRLKGVVNIEE